MGIVFNGPIASMLMTQPDTTVHPGDFYDALTYLTTREQLATLQARMAKYNVPYTTPVVTGIKKYIDRNGEKIYLSQDKKGNWGIVLQSGKEPTYEYPPVNEVKTEEQTEMHFTGQALFRALLPEDLYYEGDKGVIIQEGVLTNGVITRAHIGPERNSIIHVMSLNYSVGRVSNFLTDATFVLNRWLNTYGFSIGISSCLVGDKNFNTEVNTQIEKARLLIASMGGMPESETEAERYEEQILAYIGNPSKELAKKIQATLPKDNALNIAALSGAKGKVSNLVQIAAFAGQQHLESRRIKPEMTYETRCLPYFKTGDESIESSGFCTASFLQGLPPSQMYFHAMSAREGLLGTAVHTSDTGFMHRKAIKTLQDIKVAYDGSVRNADKTVFQYVYGDDGFSPERLQIVETRKGKFLSFIDLKNVSSQINNRYGY